MDRPGFRKPLNSFSVFFCFFLFFCSIFAVKAFGGKKSATQRRIADDITNHIDGFSASYCLHLRFRLPTGIHSTSVGYCAGYTPNPTYEEACSGQTGHTEGVRVVYDPSKVSFVDILRWFWEAHDPTSGMGQGKLYMSFRHSIPW